MADKTLSSLTAADSISSSEHLYGVVGGNSRKVPVSALAPALGLPDSITDEALLRYDAGTGLMQGTGITVDDSDNVTGVAALTASGAILAQGAYATAATHAFNFQNYR